MALNSNTINRYTSILEEFSLVSVCLKYTELIMDEPWPLGPENEITAMLVYFQVLIKYVVSSRDMYET